MPCPNCEDGAPPAVTATPPVCEIRMPNRICAVAASVDQVLSAAGLAVAPSSDGMADAADALRLALTETLNNVVEHGGGPASVPVVIVRLWRSGEVLTLCVEDTGAPFPAAAWQAGASCADTGPGADLEALPEGGWGLMLIRASVDRIVARREAGRNFLYLVKKMPPCPDWH